MESMWIQMLLGAVGSMMIGIATNLVTPVARRGAGRMVQRLRRIARRMARVGVLRAAGRRVARPVRWLIAAVRA